MKRLLIVVFVAVGLGTAGAAPQAPSGSTNPGLTLTLKDGRTFATSAVRLQGRTLMAAITTNGVNGEIGYAMDTIAKVDFPKPPQLQTATDLLAQNKPAVALEQLTPIVNYFLPLREIPGNFWAEAALLKLNALILLGRDSEVGPLIEDLARSPLDRETMQLVRVQQAAAWGRQGEYEKSLAGCDGVIRESNKPDILAQAWLQKGHDLFAQRKWEPALLAYLHIPVFYPNQKLLMPSALLGSALALTALDDVAAAEERLQEVIASYPSSPEALKAKAELEKLKKRQT